jgi:hypothetical protein
VTRPKACAIRESSDATLLLEQLKVLAKQTLSAPRLDEPGAYGCSDICAMPNFVLSGVVLLLDSFLSEALLDRCETEPR